MITLIGTDSRPLDFLVFRDCIIEIITLTVALGKSDGFECLSCFLFGLNLDDSYSTAYYSSTVFLSGSGFDRLPIDFRIIPDDFSRTYM